MHRIRLPFVCATLGLAGCGSLGPTDDAQSPLVVIVSPLPDAIVGRQVLIEANAVDDIGVDKVRFLIDGTLLGEKLSPPYRVTWGNTGLADGSTHTIRVEALNVAKNISFQQITVTISVGHGAP